MKERPILFSASMVRAILAGTKTQTRRVMRDQVVAPGVLQMARSGYCEIVNKHAAHIPGFHCPYGQPGDRLWVRETWAAPHSEDGRPPRAIQCDQMRIHYAASEDRGGLLWRPSIHMPRWASRITLEVTGVRVERLQDVSVSDARAEGMVIQPDGGFGLDDTTHYHFTDPRVSYWSLWEAINGAGSVDANPWVWVVCFRQIEAATSAADSR